MKKILLPTLLFSACISNISFAASFDCTKAASTTEKLICGDEKISALDEQLTTSYKAALEKATDKDALKKTQVEWLKQQRACKDAECLSQSYQARIAELNSQSSIVSQSATSSSTTTSSTNNVVGNKKPLTFKLVFGDSYPICQPYVDMLNKAKYTEYPACERKILPEFLQFKAVQWTEITDKNEAIESMKESLDYYYASRNELNFKNHEVRFNSVKSEILNNLAKFYKAEMDLNSDGVIKTVYRYEYLYPDGKEWNQCIQHSAFYVVDKTIDIHGDVQKAFFEKGYTFLTINSYDSQFVNINEKIYEDSWTGRNFKYDIYISEVGKKIHKDVCGIKIQ